MKKILVTGASGLIGQRLCQLLSQQGYTVHTLGRSAAGSSTHKHFAWNIEKGELDPKALEGVEGIIHLAGAGVADKRWTDARKKEIIDSRVNSTRLLYKALKKNPHSVKVIVSASAVGYYGDCGSATVTENHPAANTFLADVCKRWEHEVELFTELGLREVRCRIGIVLSRQGGALPELEKTIPMGVAGYFAKTPLYYPWIHIDDVCGIFMHALQNEQMRGPYNTTAPSPAPIKDLMRELLTARKSNALLLPAPTLALKLALGEMSDMLLSSQRCSANKVTEAGYAFKYPTLKKALKAIYNQAEA